MENAGTTVLTRIHPDEAEAVEAMARAIWPAVYSGIISEAQIAYMLDWMYAPETIRTEIKSGGVSWNWIQPSRTRAGFLAGGPLTEEGDYPLHKIYLLPEAQGTGIASRALDELFDTVAQEGGQRVHLRVNRENTRALNFYRKKGFELMRMDRAEIGRGFVMDDCLLTRQL